MQRLVDKAVWIVVVSAVAGAIYATSPSKEHIEGVSPHGIWLQVEEHDAAHCSRCNNSEYRAAHSPRSERN